MYRSIAKGIPRIAALFALAQVALHLLTADNLGFHRDEFLYLSLGRHLDWVSGRV